MSKPNRLDFSEIVAENKPSIYRICKAYLGVSEETDDLFQEVLINVWKALPGFKGNAKISTWIYRVTVNTAITYRRKLSRSTRNNVSLNGVEHSLREDTSERNEKIREESQLDRMMRAIEELNEDQRIIIGLYLEDLSYKEIAEVVGKDTNYIGVKINRIKEKLAKMMQS